MTNDQLNALISEAGATLYDTETASENGRKIYRIFISHPEGVTLELCSKITHILSPILDLDPPVSGAYFLEVSSPGIERKLSKPQHFHSSLGEMVKLKTTENEEKKGKLTSADAHGIVLEGDEGQTAVAYDTITKARTYVEW